MTKKNKKAKKLTEDDLKSLSPRQKLEVIKLAQISKMAAARYLRIVLEKHQHQPPARAKALVTHKSSRSSNSQEGDSLRIF
jgi:hypothetical protein